MTCLWQFAAACEVAVPTRRKRPVELGRVQPAVAPSVWWCRVSRGRAALPPTATKALATKSKRLPGVPSGVLDGPDLNLGLASALHAPLALGERERGVQNCFTGQ